MRHRRSLESDPIKGSWFTLGGEFAFDTARETTEPTGRQCAALGRGGEGSRGAGLRSPGDGGASIYAPLLNSMRQRPRSTAHRKR